MYDAVTLYAKALHSIAGQPKVKRVDCYDGEKWKYGFELINYMKMLTAEGMSGGIKFDKYGRRNLFRLEIIELSKEGFKKIGIWDSIEGANYTRTQREMTDTISESITNKKFVVTSRLGKPYLYKVEGEGLEGNAQFEGYSMDLIDAISKDLGFKYEFKIVKGNEYGSLNKETKQWSGLIREIQDRRADLAICDLTITHDRRTAVDFTMPFMTLGISILYSKQPKAEVNLFSFMSPLSVDVWIYMVTAYLAISLLLFFLCRCSPNEWSNPHPCNPDPDELESTFNLPNCLWFSIGSLTTQGCDLLPKAVSTRLVAGMWWFFTLIMISSYTANLAAFLTQQKMGPQIENVEQLGAQSKIKYGVMIGGSTYNFFKTSNDSLYKKMWSVMESAQPSVFVDSNEAGVERVRKSKNNYAFFMESTTIEFQMEQYCDLTQIGNLLDSKGYGIAMPPNSPYRTAISGSVLKLQESGKLLEIKKKWWSAWKSNSSSCEDYGGSVEPSNELGMSNVGGVFVVLIAGCVFSFFVAILEFLWNCRKVAVEEKITPTEAMMAELKFVFQCQGDTKPVKIVSSPRGSLRGSFLQLNIFDRLNSKERSVPRTEPLSPGWVAQ
uniref:Glutamate receptor 1 n=2 Tax=Clastoptera arizonana TaxID=38151 RepID=A0A1B6DA51_9HEMI